MPTLIVPSAPPGGTGPTLATYRRRLADELGFWLQTATTATPSGGDPSRVVLADELRDDEVGYDLVGGLWLYVAWGGLAGTQRRIVRQADVGYQGALGAVVVSRPFSSPLAAGATIEITAPLPVKRHLQVKGLNDLVNEALARIWVEARLPIAGNGTASYDLAAYPWLTSVEQVRGIYDTRWAAPGQAAELSPWGYRLVTNGATRTLVTEDSYTAADTFEMAVLVRADRLVYDGAAWSYLTTPGLIDDADQAAAPEAWVLAFGMVKALQYLTRLTLLDRALDQKTKQAMLADLLDRRRTWAAAAKQIKLESFPKPLAERTRPLVSGTSGPVWT